MIHNEALAIAVGRQWGTDALELYERACHVQGRSRLSKWELRVLWSTLRHVRLEPSEAESIRRVTVSELESLLGPARRLGS